MEPESDVPSMVAVSAMGRRATAEDARTSDPTGAPKRTGESGQRHTAWMPSGGGATNSASGYLEMQVKRK